MIPGKFFYQIFSIAWVAGLFTIICCGCSVYTPKTIDPGVSLPKTYQKQPVSPKTSTAPERWWEAWGDDRLNQIMEKAFKGNLDLDQAVARLGQLEAVARKTGASRLPYINMEGSSARSKSGTQGGATGNSYELSLTAGFEVDLWNKLKSQSLASELERDASLEDIRFLYLTISAQVVDLYYLMVEQRAQLELTDRTVKTREATLELVNQRYLEGMVTALDVYQSRQTLATARAMAPQFHSTLATTAHALSVLIGEYPGSAMEGGGADLPDFFALYPAGLPSELLTRRPDIKAALLRLRASDQKLGAAVADRFPSINLLADYGRAGTDYGTSLSETVWSLMGNFVLPLVDWGSRKAEVDRTRAVFEEEFGRYRYAVLSAFQEVEDALVNHRTTQEAIQRLKEEEAAAGSALQLAGDQYLDGLSEYLPVLTAQTLHFDAQSRLLSARRKLISDRISLIRALGGSWMDFEIKKKQFNRKNLCAS